MVKYHGTKRLLMNLLTEIVNAPITGYWILNSVSFADSILDFVLNLLNRNSGSVLSFEIGSAGYHEPDNFEDLLPSVKNTAYSRNILVKTRPP